MSESRKEKRVESRESVGEKGREGIGDVSEKQSLNPKP